MTEYVAGFMFTPDRSEVALILKNRPSWQKGKLNAIGGHVEPEEAPIQAMRREFREEAGADIRDWQLFCTLRGENSGGWRVSFYRAFSTADILTMTDEPVALYSAENLPRNVMNNLRWLIPMALSMERAGSLDVREVAA